jgi:hypothetical protein
MRETDHQHSWWVADTEDPDSAHVPRQPSWLWSAGGWSDVSPNVLRLTRSARNAISRVFFRNDHAESRGLDGFAAEHERRE